MSDFELVDPKDLTKTEFAVYIARRLLDMHSTSFKTWEEEIGLNTDSFSVEKLRSKKAFSIENYNSGLWAATGLVMDIAMEMQRLEEENE